MATDVAEGANVDWGDDTDFPSTGGIPPQEVTQNPDGTKTVIDYGMSEDGYLSKTTSVIKVEKVTKTVSRAVAARKNWNKFGDCHGKQPGLERGITSISMDEISVEWITNDEDEDEEEEEINYAKKARQDIQSHLKMLRFKKRLEEKKLGVDNWAQMMSMQASANTPNAPPAPGLRQAESSSGAPGKYVPPSKRGGASGTAGESMYSRDDSATVRISNVSRSTQEADLEELCKRFGPIRRIFLSRDRETGESKGFAFVAFVNVQDAARCIEKLDGFGYDHLILSVEWSKPREPRDGESRSGFGR
ncbi:Eukaryotic translation initiation factor 3 subunit G [Gracilariopsis chorda]|uniref:Eukaryotic translation initiation factor 3 subunit G n=1 Tax=Gracilariopsis chorda TaxID=448386 RepID=A0A2V3IPX0_9FLOR|nr:Eukaryotic translation initiation factor 3 subunit G [Gracilariopsis chorda]|eukprot:PXF44122.1 Eukaryotic translation initiation factor 3 subunit G [Gracilariopsis chorda]